MCDDNLLKPHARGDQEVYFYEKEILRKDFCTKTHSSLFLINTHILMYQYAKCDCKL